MTRNQHKQVRLLPARCPIEIAVGRHNQRGDSGLAVGNNIERRIAEIARVNARLQDDNIIVVGRPLAVSCRWPSSKPRKAAR